ncbi:MAG: GntR family transcriptional regulator [Pseudomonadota bacterium]
MDDYRQHTAEETAHPEPRNPVFEGIERAIHEQRLPPGTRLAEGELGEIYGVSRTIVRAGLQELSHAHLVSLRHNRGARVAQPSPQEAREVFEARELIEPRTAREAARRMTAADAKRLRAHCEEEKRALEASDHGRALRLSGRFHIEIATVAGQQTLCEFVEQLVARSALIIALYWSRERVRCDSNCHQNILKAMANNDPDEAESLMRSHLVDIHSTLRFADEPATKPDLRSMLT